MSHFSVPAEILVQIFELAIDDDGLFDHTLPTFMSESCWELDRYEDNWTLISPANALHRKQQRTYAAIKALLYTCRQWYRVGYHLLFRFLFVVEPSKLPSLCFALDRNASLGWYVRRLHIYRFYATRRSTLSELEVMVVSIIHQCPNLESFTVDWPIAPSFFPIADALCTFSTKSLRSIHWSLTPAALPRLIWALDSLPSLVSAFINLDPPPQSTLVANADDKTLLLGSAGGLAITMPSLKQLDLRGVSTDFLEQLIGWTLPVLESFSLDFVAQRHVLPDIIGFLKQHGSGLTFLDLNTIPAFDLSSVLDLCPVLTTFCFNPDWRLPFHAEANNANPNAPQPTLLRTPHAHITHIGLHQLLHAFTPSVPRGMAPILSPVATYLIQRTNDLTFTQLTRRFLPSLKVIRVLNRTLLRELEKSDGPEHKNGCFDRWRRWDEQCRREGVRLEDCTGALLGDLPDDEEEESDSEDEEDETVQPSNVSELKLLLEECRKMTLGRQEPMIFPPPPMRW